MGLESFAAARFTKKVQRPFGEIPLRAVYAILEYNLERRQV
jgi:hypothetical protein